MTSIIINPQVGSATPLPNGTEGQVLTIVSGAPKWANSASVPGGTSGQLQINSSGTFAGITIGGDATFDPATGALTITKTGGALFASSAIIDTTIATNITSGTLPAARLPAPTSTTLGGVESYAPISHQWINAISTTGAPSSSQPAFTDISGTVAAAQLPNPSASTLGGVQSGSAGANQFMTGINTSGVPQFAQPVAADISGLAASYVAASSVGAASGLATLDNSGKLSTSQIPAAFSGALAYQGAWNASTNSPTITSGASTAGGYYVISVAGTTTINGVSSWAVGDYIINNGTTWQKVAAASPDIVTLDSYTWGVTPVASGSASGTDAAYFLRNTSGANLVIDTLSIAVPSATPAKIAIVHPNSDGTATAVSLTPVHLAAGVNTFTGLKDATGKPLAIPAGDLVGVYTPAVSGGIYYNTSGSGAGAYSISGVPGVNSTLSSSGVSAWDLSLQVVASGVAIGGIDTTLARVTAMETNLGGQQVIGATPAAATVSSTPRSYVLQDMATVTGTVYGLKIAVPTTQTITLMACTLNSNGTLTLANSVDIPVTAGLHTLDVSLPVTAGQFIGVYYPTNLYYDSGTPCGLWYAGSKIATSTACTNYGGFTIQQQFFIASGANLVTAKLGFDGPSGIFNLLSSADATGVADATAILAAAAVQVPNPYLAPGTYAVTAMPRYGCGFWGPGKVKLNGTRFYTAQRPADHSVYLGARAELASEIFNGAPLILIGDSVTQWSSASSAATQWTNLLTRYLNAYSSVGDEPLCVNFDNISTYTPAFYGMTLSGSTSAGSVGPIGLSRILADGASISFTGTYATLGVFYEQKAGAGSLVVAYGGGTLATLTCAGSTDHDHYSGAIATGQTTSQTYTLTASGGPVEITGLQRLGLPIASAPPRLQVFRHAHGSYLIDYFAGAPTASILKQASALSATPPRVVICLGFNDQFYDPPATIAAHLAALITALKAGGVINLHGMLPWRVSSAWASIFQNGYTYDGALSALRSTYRAQGVDIIPVHAVDFAGEGMTGDGLHPTDLGQDAVAQIITSHLAGV